MPGNTWILLPGEGIDIALYGPGAIVRNLPHEGRYYFSVRARNGAGTSGWSSFLFQPATGTRETWAGVPEPVNVPATGVPAIVGVPSTGETLTADTSDIRDGNGLERVKLRYQWIWLEGTQETDIEEATAPAYRLQPADEGRAVRLRVAFTDRSGFAESLTSAATATVAANSPPTGLPEISGTARVGPDADGEDVRHIGRRRAGRGSLQVSVDLQWRDRRHRHPKRHGPQPYAVGRRPRQDLQGAGDLYRRPGQQRNTDQCANGRGGPSFQYPGHGATHHQREIPGGQDADGGHFRDSRRRRAGHRFIHPPVDRNRRDHGGGHTGCDSLHLHSGPRRGGQDHQGAGHLHG